MKQTLSRSSKDRVVDEAMKMEPINGLMFQRHITLYFFQEFLGTVLGILRAFLPGLLSSTGFFVALQELEDTKDCRFSSSNDMMHGSVVGVKSSSTGSW